MALNDIQSNNLLTNARNSIGDIPYGTGPGELDCSHFVQKVYAAVGMFYPYVSTKQFPPAGYFVPIKKGEQKPGDVILFKNHHMGIWDPLGCSIAKNDLQCKKRGEISFLSAQSGLGYIDYGNLSWWPYPYTIWRWNK